MNLSLRSARRAITISTVTAGALVLAPQAASAAVTCIANDYGEMMVALDSAGDSAVIAANADGTITMNVPCTGGSKPATVHSVDWIDVWDKSTGDTDVVLDVSQGSFAPGATRWRPASARRSTSSSISAAGPTRCRSTRTTPVTRSWPARWA